MENIKRDDIDTMLSKLNLSTCKKINISFIDLLLSSAKNRLMIFPSEHS